MDRAFAICVIHSGRCPHSGDVRTKQPGPNWFLYCGALLANKSWSDRKGANDRDRGDLLFTIRLCSHSVFAALGTKTLTLPYLRRALDLSWFRPAGERSKSRPVLLSYRWRRSLAKSSPPQPNSPGALHWSCGNARNFCDLADSVLSGVTFSVAFASLVTRSGGRISRRRRQIRGLVTKLPPRLRLSTSLGTTSPVYSIE